MGVRRSGVVYKITQAIPFASFNPQLAITTRPVHGYAFVATVKLGSGAAPINPVRQGLTLTIGTYTLTIIPGVIVSLKRGVWGFEGKLNGVPLEVGIVQISTNGYLVEVGASGVTLNVTTPVPVTLTLDPNTGTVLVHPIT